MFSLRSKSEPARIASAAILFVAALLLLAAIPVRAVAAPEGGEEPPVPQLAFEPDGHDFGLIEANRANGEATLELRNVGAVPAPVYSIEVTGSGSWAFSSNGPNCFSHPLEPGESCSVQVYFHPQDAIPYEAQLRAVTEGGAGFSAELSGEGGRPRLTTAADPTNFGSVAVGSGAVVRTIDVTNEGNLPGGAFIAVISGGAVGSFHLLDENCTGFLLSPGATCNLQVSFEPISTGSKTARLFLVGDGDGGTQIALSGVGLPAAQQASPRSSGESAAPQAQSQPRRKHRKRGQRRRGGVKIAIAARRAIR